MSFSANNAAAQAPAAPNTLDRSSSSEIEELRVRCPLPVLMSRMGYAKHAKKTCCSPFRPDQKPSWGIFNRNGRWFWKDHGNGESGDEIEFILRAKKFRSGTPFHRALEHWNRVADGKSVPEEVVVVASQAQTHHEKPDRSAYGPGTDEQLERLCQLRRIDPLGIVLAQQRGVLVFGRWGTQEVYGVTDSSGHVLEVRRLDGEPFPAWGSLTERKCHSVKGSRKDWPVGLAEVGSKPMVLLVEGGPDFLAAFEVVAREGAQERVCPVAMLSAGAAIATDALPLFKGKHVRILPHHDEAGRKAAARWQHQLVSAGAAKVDFALLCAEAESNSVPFKDLNDFLPLYRHDLAASPTEGRLL